jgi:hypothetical protein
MKQCTYCGKEYPDEATSCLLDGHTLALVELQVSSRCSTATPHSLRSARRFVTIIAVANVACSGLVSCIYIVVAGTDRLAAQVTNLAFTSLLSISLVRGWNPGRVITVVLMGLASIKSIRSGFQNMAQPVLGMGLVALGIFCAGCAIGLLTPLAAAHFSSPRQGERTDPCNNDPSKPIE